MALSLEILISTMNKSDFSFLEEMFKNNGHFSNYKLLIINQTSSDRVLKSEWENIRVINSYSLGSPTSRNTAIFHAQGDICLMADDDIVYEPEFDRTVLNAYKKYPQAGLISFEAVNEYGKKQAAYPPEGRHTKSSLFSVFTWCLSFRRTVIRENEVFFNHYFGVGSEFKGMTEIMFLRNAWFKKIEMMHCPQVIVQHPEESSGRRMGSDEAFYARAAGAQRFYGSLSYLWLFKYTFFTLRKGLIKPQELLKKYAIGLEGIKKYKQLKKNNSIDSVIYED
jgi:glycosyltransferase involved in cell wall biosynthesis